MAIAAKKKPAAAKKKNASNVKSTKNVNGSFDIKNINSEQMLFFVLQDIKTSINKLDENVNNRINKLDDKIDSNSKELNDKIDRNFLWTLGVMITSLSIMIGGFIGLVAVILSKH